MTDQAATKADIVTLDAVITKPFWFARSDDPNWRHAGHRRRHLAWIQILLKNRSIRLLLAPIMLTGAAVFAAGMMVGKWI
jgi:hypothetical protein